jgi:hypothetical protein
MGRGLVRPMGPSKLSILVTGGERKGRGWLYCFSLSITHAGYASILFRLTPGLQEERFLSLHAGTNLLLLRGFSLIIRPGLWYPRRHHVGLYMQ